VRSENDLTTTGVHLSIQRV